ncbi:MAG: transglutaminase-like cysteine peptidase [Glycocaulis sp.]
MNGFGPEALARMMRGLALSCLAGLAVTACATTPPASSHMPVAGVAMPPAGLIDMCRRAPEICGSVAGAQADAGVAVVLASADIPLAEATGATLPVLRESADGAKAHRLAPDAGLLEGTSDARGEERGEARADQPDAGAGTQKQAEQAAGAAEGEGAVLDGDDRLVAAPELFALLNRVNQSINMRIRPRDDQDVYGVSEYWTLPLTLEGTAEGDCEDYALEKRQALIAAGIPERALFLAVGYSLATGRHAVLVVSTDQGDYVLDNMTPYILPWTQTPYRWTARQMPGDLLSWRHMAELTS